MNENWTVWFHEGEGCAQYKFGEFRKKCNIDVCVEKDYDYNANLGVYDM